MMCESLQGARFLLLEDNYYLAMDMTRVLAGGGACVLGPFADEGVAIQSVRVEPPDAALIDVNTSGGPSFDLARDLHARDIPFAFVTGYDRASIPREFRAVIRCEKPVEEQTLLMIARRLLGGTADPRSPDAPLPPSRRAS